MLHLDIPTPDQLRTLAETRTRACVSIYLPTTPLSQHSDASRIELSNLAKEAVSRLAESGVDKKDQAAISEYFQDLVDDYEFWRFQAHSLAVLATPDHLWTFRLPTTLQAQAHVSGRFHLKPLLRAVTFPQSAFVLALSENSVRLIEVFTEGPPHDIEVPNMPVDAASAVGLATLNDRSPSGRITGSEGKKVRLAQFARQVDAALRPVLAATKLPVFLASAEPLASIFRAHCSSVDLAKDTLPGNAERSSNLELDAAVRPLLDKLHDEQIAQARSLFSRRGTERRATADLSDAARAAAMGAIDTLLVDIEAVVHGTFDESTGAITLADSPSKDTYGVVDAIALRALATGARVLGVRAGDLPGGQFLAATLRYPI